ncbi:MAG: TSUP family transporter [Candidatus Nanopelagicaceae bacterium]
MLAFPGTHTVKIFPEHLHINSLQKVIAKFQPHILILRRNHLDRYISLKKADASGKWHEGNSSDIQIEVNDAELNKYITKYIDWYTNVKQTATANGCQILDIEFKDLHNAEVTTQIQKFVSFDGSGIDQLPKTPTIISTTSTAPRKVIGTVSASEFCVALAASLGFLINFNKIELEWATVGGLALGGVIAAPIAAKFVAKLHPKHLGIIVGIAIITINAVNIIRA